MLRPLILSKCQVVRRRIIAEGLRVDGRRLDEVRPLYCEAGNLPQLHGSSLFSRGDTQVSKLLDAGNNLSYLFIYLFLNLQPKFILFDVQ